MFWVGCASYIESDMEEGQLPNKNDIIWHCFATSEAPILKRLFSKNTLRPMETKSLSSQIAF